MTFSLKNLIRKRQKALNNGNYPEFNRLRNRVNQERKKCRSKFYEAKVKHLKSCKPTDWWKETKKLCGMSSTFNSRDQMYKSLEIENIDNMTTRQLANAINEIFLSSMNDFAPLPSEFYCYTDIDSNEPIFAVTEQEVFMKLIKLNPTKANGPDGIPSWLLKENADVLAEPIKEILNSSYREASFPKLWKRADVVPLPKQKLVKEVNKHLRPISLTSVVSKVAEDFIVESFVKPAVLGKIDRNQFGTIPKSSTTHALINMIHNWNKHTDGNGSTVRVILFDFKKAFDLIDHAILVGKLITFEIPKRIIAWIVSFLKNREQRVKLSQDCYSEWGLVQAGVPQGTKLGPWLFVIMISDLELTDTDLGLWKYVDDTTISETVLKNDTSSIQSAVDELTRKSSVNKFCLNEDKCKELRITFAKSVRPFAPVYVNNRPIEVVPCARILGLRISNDLKWNACISEIVKKVSTRLFFLCQLKRTKVNSKDLLLFYLTCVRPVMEYGCPVFHDSLPNYLCEDLEKLQKRAFRIIYPTLSYAEALEEANVDTLFNRRQFLTSKFFNEIVNDDNHKLYDLLPSQNSSNYNIRRENIFNVSISKTNRFKNSFIQHNSLMYFK